MIVCLWYVQSLKMRLDSYSCERRIWESTRILIWNWESGKMEKETRQTFKKRGGILIEPSHQLCGGVARWGPSIEKKRTWWIPILTEKLIYGHQAAQLRASRPASIFFCWTGNAESPNPNISTECMVDVYTSKYTNILYKGIAFLEPSFKRGGKEEALFNVHALQNQSTPGDIGIQTRRYVMFEAVSCCIQEEEDRDGQRSTDRRADDIYAPLLFNL